MNSSNEVNPGVVRAREEALRLASQEAPAFVTNMETTKVDEPRLSERAVGQEGMRLFEASRIVDTTEAVRLARQVGELIADYRTAHQAHEALVPVTTRDDMALGA